MRTRGLTLIEILVAVGLMSLVMIAAASWIQTTTRASSEFATPARWEVAAQAVLALIHDDICTGDFESHRQAKDGIRLERARVNDGRLSIMTRGHGEPCTHEFTLDTLKGELSLEEKGSS